MYVSDPREGCTVVEETKVVAQFAVGAATIISCYAEEKTGRLNYPHAIA